AMLRNALQPDRSPCGAGDASTRIAVAETLAEGSETTRLSNRPGGCCCKPKRPDTAQPAMTRLTRPKRRACGMEWGLLVNRDEFCARRTGGRGLSSPVQGSNQRVGVTALPESQHSRLYAYTPAGGRCRGENAELPTLSLGGAAVGWDRGRPPST